MKVLPVYEDVPIGKVLAAGLVAVLAEVAGIALGATAAWLIVSAAGRPPLAELTVAIVVVRTLAIAKGGLRYGERLAGHGAVLRAMAVLRGQVYAALTRRRDVRTGDVLTRVVSDVDAVQDALLRCMVPAFVAAVVGVGGLAVTAFVSGTAFVVLGCGLGLMVLLAVVSGWWASRTARASVEARAQLADHMVDLIHGADELVVYGARDRKLEEADGVAVRIAAVDRRSGAFLGALGVVVSMGTVLALVLVLPPGPGSAALALGVLTGMEVLLPLISAAALWTSVRPAVRRVSELLTAPSSPPRPSAPVELDLSAGKRIAIVGPSGAGKSTLLAAIADRNPQARGAMADAHVFTVSIRDNLSFAGDDIEAAAELVQLDSWVQSLPAGWDTAISAETISGGQRQRLILARALVGHSPVLVLDEPVEGLETTQGDQILADVLAATSDRAVVLVTHRLRQLASFEDIVVLVEGRVVQRGSHAALIAQPGYYRDSWEAEVMISTPLP